MEHPSKEIVGNVTLAAPSVITLVYQRAFAVTINEVLAAVSIAFILLQAAYLIWKWVKEARKS